MLFDRRYLPASQPVNWAVRYTYPRTVGSLRFLALNILSAALLLGGLLQGGLAWLKGGIMAQGKVIAEGSLHPVQALRAASGASLCEAGAMPGFSGVAWAWAVSRRRRRHVRRRADSAGALRAIGCPAARGAAVALGEGQASPVLNA